MEITKTVDRGFINVQITDYPLYPDGTRFEGNVFLLEQHSLAKERVEDLGDVYKIHCGDFMFCVNNPARTGVNYYWDKRDSAESIAQKINLLHQHFYVDYNNFVHKNTQSVTVMSIDVLAPKLQSESKLYYKASDGSIKPLD